MGLYETIHSFIYFFHHLSLSVSSSAISPLVRQIQVANANKVLG